MKRLGVFGGTFNPIHLGHINLVSHAARELELDRVLLIPTFIPPHKQAGDLAGGAHRLEMCRLAAQGMPLLEPCGLELERGGASYTYETLRELSRRYPAAALYLIVGGDMLASFRQWKQWELILELAVLCAAPRTLRERQALTPAARELDALGKGCRLLQAPVMELSSTDIRRRIRQGRDTQGMLDERVAGYIAAHGLYK